jgi:hypothetical protein
VQFNTVAEFVLYVIPGFIALEVYRAAYPVKTRSDFVSLTWSAIFGIMISYFLIWINGTLLSNVLHYTAGSLPSFEFLLGLICFGLAIGLIRILLHFLRFKVAASYKAFRGLNPDPQSVWVQVNRTNNRQWATVFLDDASIYLGFIETYKYDPDAIDQDFLLGQARRVDENLNVLYSVDGLGVYLNTKNVKRIEFYKGESDPKSIK